MTPKYLFGLSVLLACCLLRVDSRPSPNESTNLSEDESKTKKDRAILERADGPVYYQADTEKYLSDDTTLDIVEKIKAINNGLTKPKREQINFNLPYDEKSQGIDQEILKKLQDIIASGKLQSNSLKHPQDYHNIDEDRQITNSRALKMNPEIFVGNGIQMMPFPYIMNLPVIVTPTGDILNKLPVNNNFKSVLPNDAYHTRQSSFPGLPFFQNLNFEWPFTQNLFPLLIKNPFVAFSQGGGWENFIEYGQSADVCNRKQKSGGHMHLSKELDEDEEHNDSNGINDTLLKTKITTRKSRALKKRTIPNKSPSQEIGEGKSSKKIYVTNQSPPKRTTKKPHNVERIEDTKNDDSGGDLRFPFGDFNWFGDKKPAVPLPPGFFINRLRVRKGGVAIAGPGGVATAGRGGTAIVGPGGLAYTQPGGLAVAGPHARIVALPETTDINEVLSSLQENDSSVPAASQPIRHGKLHEYLRSVQPRHLEGGQDVYNYDGVNFIGHTSILPNSTFLLHVSPRAFAISGNKGVAISNPISSVIVRPGDIGSIVHDPQATAIVGPGGIAHAESELNIFDDATQYIPFYGGAKGQYLEVKKDTRGTVLSEKVVAEKSISPEHIHKNNNDNVLSKVLTVNLENLRTLSSSLLKLQSLGRKIGSLGTQEKAKFKSDLLNLGEAASNTIKLIDEVADDIDVLFKKNTTILRKNQEDDYYDDVGEEGIGIDSANSESGESSADKNLIAEAKPVGLAVIGESGVAASRPMATAVATSGVAIARPIGTAIAGIDPSLLGIDFNVNQARKTRVRGKIF